MADEQITIEFLTSKVKQLELDVQYELHRANQAEEKYQNLRQRVSNIVQELSSCLTVDLV